MLGWPGHEDQWRGGDPSVRAQIGPRRDDVAAIYSGADMARAAVPFEAITRSLAGAKVKILEQRDGQARVRNEFGDEGWVDQKSLLAR